MNLENPYQSPQTQPTQRSEDRTLSWTLFSFQGRIPRRVFWGASLISWVAFGVIFGLLAPLAPKSTVVPIVMLLLYIPFFWISLAVTIKRWHDRDKSGFWIFIGLIPIVGPIWAFVETGCLRGTMGPNRFGDDPT